MLDRRLHYFLAVAREGSFSRAADVLHVAQPAVSRQVALLEAELGLRLLERGPAGVACTEAGALLAARGEELARAAGALRAELDGLRSGARGRVLLGYSTSLGYGAAPAVIAALRARLPDVDVLPQLRPTPELAGAVARGDLDLALLRSATDAGAAGLRRTVVRRERVGVLLDAGHRLAAGDGAIAVGDLRDVPLALHDRAANPGHHDFVVGVLRAAGVTPRIVAPTTPFDPAYGHLVGTDAVSLASESARDGTPAALTWRRLTGAPPVEVSLLERAAEPSPVVRRAADAVREAAAAERWL